MELPALKTFVCMKWGTRYGADYVRRLWSMIRRHTTGPVRLVCYTDDLDGCGAIEPPIEVHPLPPIALPDDMIRLPWRKLTLWSADLPGLAPGEPALFLDLDVVVTGPMDDFFTFRPEAPFCVIHNWTQPELAIGNTTCYRFHTGCAPELLAAAEADPHGILARWRNEQKFVSGVIRLPMVYWPAAWCVSFKHSLLPRWPMNFFRTAPLPADARLVAFTGKPDPDEARDGHWPAPWYKKTYKHVRPTPWIAENWQ